MQFDLTDEERMIQEMAAKFALRELRPKAAELDRTKDRTILLGNLKKLAELGFMGLNLRAEYGGAETTAVAFSLAMTELGKGCASTTVTTSVTNMVGQVIQSVGNEAQRRRYLPPLCSGEYAAGGFGLTEATAGSDPAGMRTTARLDGDHWRAQRPQDLHQQRRVCRGLRGLGGHRQGRPQRQRDQRLSGGAGVSRLCRGQK